MNIKLETANGKYVIKIFSKERNSSFVERYIESLLAFKQAKIAVPDLIKSNGKYLFSPSKKIFLCVMKYFEGKSFLETSVSGKDIVTITKYLAKINQFRFKVNNYDHWSPTHLLIEFPKKQQFLGKKDLLLIKPVIDQLKRIDFSKLPKGIIHGALEKGNILRNSKGEYCILDLGCMDFNARVFDLAIFLAAFCLDPSKSFEQNSNEYRLVIKEYSKSSPISKEEKDILPLLIKASYAAYILTPNYLLVNGIDRRAETKKFLSLGRKGLKSFEK